MPCTGGCWSFSIVTGDAARRPLRRLAAAGCGAAGRKGSGDVLARDLMRREVKTVSPDATVQEVAEILAEEEYTGLPVVDDEGRLVGVVTEADLLVRAKQLRLPTVFPFLGGVIFLESPRRFEEQLRKATATRVREVMTSDVVTVTEDTPLHELAAIMVEKKVNRLPVVEGHRLVGIVTRDDLIRAIHLQGQAGGASR